MGYVRGTPRIQARSPHALKTLPPRSQAQGFAGVRIAQPVPRPQSPQGLASRAKRMWLCLFLLAGVGRA
jgi:hypothetical protein